MEPRGRMPGYLSLGLLKKPGPTPFLYHPAAGRLRQGLGAIEESRAYNVTNTKSLGSVAVEAVGEGRDIYINYIAICKLSTSASLLVSYGRRKRSHKLVWDPMGNYVVDTCAARLWKTRITKRRWVCIIVYDKIMNRGVNLVRRSTDLRTP